MDREEMIKVLDYHLHSVPKPLSDAIASAIALLKEQETYEKEIKELITELAIEKQKQISNMKSELQVQTSISDIQYQNAMMQTQLSFH